MKVLSFGHKYELENFDQPHRKGQVIQFIEKDVAVVGSKEMRVVNDGTTNEDVIRVLIDRVKVLNNKFPCRENDMVVQKLAEALMWLEFRTAEREARGVDGKHTA